MEKAITKKMKTVFLEKKKQKIKLCLRIFIKQGYGMGKTQEKEEQQKDWE